MRLHRSIALIAALAAGIAHAEHDWPERTVTTQEMRVVSMPPITVPRVRARGNVERPAVLRLHVDAEGAVRHVVLVDSCGSPDHDRAAIQALRSARFQPKVIDGGPQEVTLLLPVDLPRTKNNPWH